MRHHCPFGLSVVSTPTIGEDFCAPAVRVAELDVSDRGIGGQLFRVCGTGSSVLPKATAGRGSGPTGMLGLLRRVQIRVCILISRHEEKKPTHL